MGPQSASDTENIKCSRLLGAIRRRGRMSRLALARQLGISNSRVCDLVQQMLEAGLLVEETDRTERRGRRGVPLELNPGYGHLVGFDMEARRMRLVVVDFAGRVLWQERQNLAPPRDRQHLIDQVLTFIDTQMAEHIRPRYDNLLGLGLAANGVIDAQRGVILHYDLVPAARDLPLRDLVQSRIDLPCVMADNIRAMTLAEWHHGVAREFDSFVCLAVRSGIGAGVVINGRLHTGAHGFAGEAGYMPVPAGDGFKHLQQLVSETALNVDVEAEDYALPQRKAQRAGETLGAQLASIAALIDPQAIVLAGGLLKPDGPLWHHAVRAFRQHALTELAERVQVLPAQLGPYAAAIGATHRTFQHLFPVEAA